MPLECLNRLIASGLPVAVTNASDIDNLRICVAAGLAIAELPFPGDERLGAVLIALTAEGRAALIRGNFGPLVAYRAD